MLNNNELKVFCKLGGSLLLFLLTITGGLYAQTSLHDGDIIFQKLPCGGLCDAIIATTPCKPGLAFNHCGIIYFDKGAPFVLEAIGKAVQQTSLADFEKRDTERVIYVGRIDWGHVPWGDPSCMAKALIQARHYLGTPYDDAFLPGDSALYCSELVWESFRDRTSKPIFSLQPMTFRSPESHQTFPAWLAYYNELHRPVPEGVPGINPCAIANAPFITMMMLLKDAQKSTAPPKKD